jgi:hypothetical protein
MAKARRTIWMEDDLQVKSGAEWHSVPIPLGAGDVITLSAHAPEVFYAGIFSREEYFARGGPSAEMFDFPFGSDRKAVTRRRTVQDADDYYLVFRVGVWSSNTIIHARVEILRPV